MNATLLARPDPALGFDAPWHDALNALAQTAHPSARIVAPAMMAHVLPGLVTPAETAGHDPATIDAVALHKGQFQALDPAFLAAVLRDMPPVHANAVFIVFARGGAALDPRHPHLGALGAIRDWLAERGYPARVSGLGSAALATPEALDAMARLIARRLVKPIDPADPLAPLAIAETAERFNDSAWFWIDDAGKAAELFALPRLRKEWPHVADALIDQILALSPGELMHRRMALPELRLFDPAPTAFAAQTAFFSVTGDLAAGAVRPTIRYNDGRGRFIGEFAGHSLHFTWGLKRHAIDVETCIDTTRIDHTPEGLVFEHTGTIRAEPLLGPPRDLARLTYRYCLRADHAAIGLEVVLKTLPGIALGNVEVTTAIDQLTRGGAFNQAWVGHGGAFRECAVPDAARGLLHEGPADYLGVVEGSRSPATGHAGTDPGFAIGFHVRFGAPGQVRKILAQGQTGDRFHWIRVFHALGDCPPGSTVRLSEQRLVTGGGFYASPERYAALFDVPRDPRRAIDPAMSYDIGAELNAVAATLLFAARGDYDPPLAPQRCAELRSWFDRHLAAYCTGLAAAGAHTARVVFVRGLAFAVMAADAMARAFPDCAAYRDHCVTLAARLRETASAVIDAPDEAIFTPFIDCQGAAILALVRAMAHLGEDRDATADLIARAIRAIRSGEVSKALFGRGEARFVSLFTRPGAGLPPVDAGFWVFKLGLVLRALAAVRLAHADLPQCADLADHIAHCEAVARDAIAAVARIDGDTIEILTAEGSTETNSETQPWAALGLVPAIEAALAAMPASDVAAPARFAEFDRMAPPLAIAWQASAPDLAWLVERVADSWTELGEARPHWSVMSNPEFAPDRIAANLATFHASGAADADRLCATLRRLGRDPAEFDHVLEFGCGLGRVTNHLARRFTRISARDVSLPHLALARAHSRAAGFDGIDYAPVTAADFGMTQGFDVWFSVIVLQHNPPPVIAAILARAFALLNPGGIAVFQLPTYAHGYRFALAEYLSSAREPGAFEMHCLPQPAVFALAAQAGCVPLEVIEDHVLGDPAWTSHVFAIARPA